MFKNVFRTLSPLILAIAVTVSVGFDIFANGHRQESAGADKCKGNAAECDSLDIPVFIVDGVEVQNIDGLSEDDVFSFSVVKDPAIVNIFRPRMGGVVVITTKSKKYLTPVLQDYGRKSEEEKRNRIPGQLLIR